MSFENWKDNQFKLGNIRLLEFTKAKAKKGDLVGDWKLKYNQKKKNAKKEDINFDLTFIEYLTLLYKANIISINQLGVKRFDYQLSRIGDKGEYSFNNCRFITKLENEREKDKSFYKTEEFSKMRTNQNIKRVENGTHPFLKNNRIIWEG